MKQILLLVIVAFSSIASAQTPISHYQGVIPETEDEDGTTLRFYFRGIPAAPIDQSASGSNVSWDFSGITFNIDHHDYKNWVPTSQIVSQYPNCNLHLSIAEDTPEETANIYANYTDGIYTILRADGEIMSLDYTVNPAFIGEFPMDFGYLNSDATAGNFTYSGNLGTFQGTFAGTVDSHFDAFGTLQFKNDMGQTETVNVSRLKVTQITSLSVPFLPDAGSLVQTSFYYYAEDDFGIWPFIRTIETQLSVPVLDIDQHMMVYEKGPENYLSTPSAQTNTVKIFPNPATNLIRIADAGRIASVEINSLDGKSMIESASDVVDVSSLASGIYIIRITSESGNSTQKFVKK